MPIYPYVCTACGHEFDSLQKISDDPLKDCPECGEPRLRKRLTAPSFQLKGTGWYETDFKNSGKKQQSDGNGKDSSSKQGQEQGQETGQEKNQEKSQEKSQDAKGDGNKDQSATASDNTRNSSKGGAAQTSSKPAAGKDD